jgi:hypothetical protein
MDLIKFGEAGREDQSTHGPSDVLSGPQGRPGGWAVDYNVEWIEMKRDKWLGRIRLGRTRRPGERIPWKFRSWNTM